MQLSKPRVIIVGGGFGGLQAAKSLKNARVDIILIDKTNHHLFQPLLYQVATSALSPGDIAVPIRSILRNYSNVQVMMNEVIGIDMDKRTVQMCDGSLEYDYLILSPGSHHSYFGRSEWEKFAPGLKTLNDALEIREKILLSFEKAERVYHSPERAEYLNFVIVGGGPTGVEIAGAIAEIGRKIILPDFPLLKKEDVKITLIEAGNCLLPSFTKYLSDYTSNTLNKMGVEILFNTRVIGIEHNLVKTTGKEINTANIFWAAGNEASPLLKDLNARLDNSGRLCVNPDLSVPNQEEIFVIGDSAFIIDGKGCEVSCVAPAATQEAKYVAKIIKNKIPFEKRIPFIYYNKGNLATIGKAKAVAMFNKLKFSGFLAWIIWAFVHILFLIEFRNRVRVMIEWIWFYLTNKPGARLIIRNKNKRGKNNN